MSSILNKILSLNIVNEKEFILEKVYFRDAIQATRENSSCLSLLVRGASKDQSNLCLYHHKQIFILREDLINLT